MASVPRRSQESGNDVIKKPYLNPNLKPLHCHDTENILNNISFRAVHKMLFRLQNRLGNTTYKATLRSPQQRNLSFRATSLISNLERRNKATTVGKRTMATDNSLSIISTDSEPITIHVLIYRTITSEMFNRGTSRNRPLLTGYKSWRSCICFRMHTYRPQYRRGRIRRY